MIYTLTHVMKGGMMGLCFGSIPHSAHHGLMNGLYATSVEIYLQDRLDGVHRAGEPLNEDVQLEQMAYLRISGRLLWRPKHTHTRQPGPPSAVQREAE